MFTQIDYATSVMLFEFFCIVGFALLALIYLHWYSKFWTDEDFPGAHTRKNPKVEDS